MLHASRLAVAASRTTRAISSTKCLSQSFGRYQKRFNSTVTAKPSDPAKPRAVGHTSMSKKKPRYLILGALAGAGGLAAYFTYQNDFNAEKLTAKFREWSSAVLERNTGDPIIEDLQKALGPLPPDGYISVLLSVEDVILKREWDRRYGWVYEPREGVKELLRSLVDPNAGVFVTLWSENSLGVANEVMDKLMQEIGGPPAHTAPLGIEHMFLRDGNKRKEKRLEYFNRDPATVLLVDANPVSEQLNPSNTVLVEPMSHAAEKKKTAVSGGHRPSTDTTCLGVKALVQRIREDAQVSGSVNVPRTLARLRQDALNAGYSTDTQGMYHFLLAAAEEEAALERERREAGLGGFMRRTLQSNGVLRNKHTTVEAAMMRGFEDPEYKLGADSIIVQKYRAAAGKLFRPQGMSG